MQVRVKEMNSGEWFWRFVDRLTLVIFLKGWAWSWALVHGMDQGCMWAGYVCLVYLYKGSVCRFKLIKPKDQM